MTIRPFTREWFIDSCRAFLWEADLLVDVLEALLDEPDFLHAREVFVRLEALAQHGSMACQQALADVSHREGSP